MEAKLTEKRWNKEIELKIVDEWSKSGKYLFNQKSNKKVFSIDTPPPYVNTPIHIGQATTYVLMDMFARYKRMKGREVLFPVGLDRNGLPIEMAAEKKFKVSLNDIEREKAIQMCESILEESSLASLDTFKKAGIAFNSWEKGNEIGDIYYTDSPEYRALTQATFIDLWKKGLIYEADRINNYCPGCQTTIADSEVEYEEKSSSFNDIIFKCKETGQNLIIGTTRPELVCTCGMVIFNPNDERYKKLDGKTAITPIFEKEIPIKAHPMAEMEKGTGLAMMCSAGDLTDIRFFIEMNLTPVIAINKNGTMNENAGFLKGLKVKEARQKMIDTLKEKELLVDQKPVVHKTPICERSKHEIEFISMKEFYLKQLDYKEDMKKLANQLNFFAESSREILLRWIDSVAIDWPISRSRYYATEVPVWYCKKCEEVILPPKGKYYKPWKENPPIKECPKCKHTEFRGDTRVFDTWFDSSISPLYILKYESNEEFFNKNTPCSLRPQGKEIVRTWLYYTLLKDYLLTGKCIFEDVWVNFHIVDEKGHKMSKSKGNVIDPKDALDKYGAEPFRLWASVEGNLQKKDFICNFERIAGATKTINKLWNVSRFISMFDEPDGDIELREVDNWILNEMNNLIEYCDKRFEQYDFHNPGVKLRNFLWETFASHYLEICKKRAYNEEELFSKKEQNGALFTLHYCLRNIMKLFAPILPIITYKVHLDLYGTDLHFEEFPTVKEKIESKIKTEDVVKVNGNIWKYKEDNNLSLRDEIQKVILPKILECIGKDIQLMHSIKNIKFEGETIII
jgi:valyl-tRNA synthetase